MAYFRCIGNNGGGGTLPTKYWHGTQSQFDAITTKSDDTVYHIEFPADGSTSRPNISNICGLYIGNTKIYPCAKNGYDYWIEDLFFPDTNATGISNIDYELNTGLDFCSATNKDRDWQIEFKATLSTTATLSGDQLICGVGNSVGSSSTIKELYFDTSGNLKMAGSGIGDSQYLADANGHDIKLVFSRSANTIEIYKDGTLGNTITNVGSTSAYTRYDLGISRYNNNYRFHGTINYFKFKWLS